MKYGMGVAFILVGAALGFAASQGLHAQGKPAAYAIILQDVIDDAKFQPIAQGFNAENKKVGAKYLARGKPVASIDGTAPGRATITQFPDVDAAKKFFASDGVKKLQADAKQVVKNRTIFVVEGAQ
jgi:uncharacterized protein (DUF1330 family)